MNDFTITSTSVARQYLALTKPRVVILITFCAVIGMFLSTHSGVPLGVLVSATLGITLIAAAAQPLHRALPHRSAVAAGSAVGLISVSPG
jgi:protoheme IX farnesyltransferase